MRFKAEGRTGHYSGRGPEAAQRDGRSAVHACASQPAADVNVCAVLRQLRMSSASWDSARRQKSADDADKRFEKKTRLATMSERMTETLEFRLPVGFESDYASLTAAEVENGLRDAEEEREVGRDEEHQSEREPRDDEDDEDYGEEGEGEGEDDPDEDDGMNLDEARGENEIGEEDEGGGDMELY